jgi:hypothetical protein
MRIKPHHFVDILRAVGRGDTDFLNPHPYGHALHQIAARILADPEIRLQIELGIDDICQPCVHHVDGHCDDVIDTSFRPLAPSTKEDWNRLIDQRWCQLLDIDSGSQWTARELSQQLMDHSDQMEDVYREMPPDRIAVRREELQRGVENFLSK